MVAAGKPADDGGFTGRVTAGARAAGVAVASTAWAELGAGGSPADVLGAGVLGAAFAAPSVPLADAGATGGVTTAGAAIGGWTAGRALPWRTATRTSATADATPTARNGSRQPPDLGRL